VEHEVVLGNWRNWRARRRAEKERESEHVRARTWAIFREVANPLVAEGLARLTCPTSTEGPWEGAALTQCVALDPAREGPAPVWVEPVGNAYINLAVGEPFPGGATYELLIEDGWEDELRACLEAVVDGRYRDRVYRGRLGDVWEMVFDLPEGERIYSHHDLSGSGYGTEPGEYSYAPYRE
jgi:hypothetical protein